MLTLLIIMFFIVFLFTMLLLLNLIYTIFYFILVPFNLNAFNITVILLHTIAKLAIIGFIDTPRGLKIPIATGIIRVL